MIYVYNCIYITIYIGIPQTCHFYEEPWMRNESDFEKRITGFLLIPSKTSQMVSESANRQSFDLDSQEFLLPWIFKKPPYIVLHLLLDVSSLVAKNMWCIIHPIQVFSDVSTPDTTTYVFQP